MALAAGYAPGVALSALVAGIGYLAAPYVAHVVPIPNMVIALVVGIALNPLAARPAMLPGMRFCVSTVLRWAVALLGLRVGLADIAALGLGTAVLIVVALVATLVSGFVFAKWYGRGPGFGALVGVGTAVCGASATLAVSTVVPDYPGKQPDIAFVVVAVNALATIAMLIYPPLCILLGFDAQTTGVMLGGTIHDVAQVVGAGYAVSTAVGNTAVIVKLFRVFLLLPVVLGVGWYFTRIGMKHGEARVPVPVFAIVFLILCAVNSAVPIAAVAAAGLCPGQGRAVGSLDLGPAAGDRRARAGHLGQDHHRARLAAHHHRARRDRRHLGHRDRRARADAAGLVQRHRLEIRRQHDLQHFAIVGITEHGVLDLRRLDPARAGAEGVHAFALELAFDPALEHIDHLELDVVIMRRRHFFRPERRNELDDMRLHHAGGRRRDAEIAVFGVSAQPGVEVLVAVMADGEFVFRPRFGRAL